MQMETQNILKRNQQQDLLDKKRADDFEARNKRIQDAMDRMAVGALKRSNAAEKEFENKIVSDALENDRKNIQKDKEKKEALRKRD